MRPAAPPDMRTAVTCLLLAALYVIAAKIGLAMAVVHANATAVWPPTGIALAALLLGGLRLWPGVLLGAFVANITTDVSFAVATGIALGNTLEALAGGWLVSRYAAGARALERPENVFRFTFAVVAATLLSAGIGATSLCLGGAAAWGQFTPIWLTWWLGDMAGGLLLTPVLLAWTKTKPSADRSRALEAFALAATAMGIGRMVFSSSMQPPGNPPLPFLVSPILVWAAFRFGVRGASTATLLVAAASILGTLEGGSPWSAFGPAVSLLLIQGFLMVNGVTALAIAALVAELRGDQELQEFIDAMTTFTAKISTDGRLLLVNKLAIQASGVPAEQLIGMDFLAGPWFTFDPEVESRVRAAFRRALGGQQVNYDEKLQVYGNVVLTINFSLVPMRDARGRVAWIMAEGRDITALKIAEDELRSRTDELARSNTELETFASVASHDLQEPLRKIQLFGERLEEKAEGLDPTSKDYLQRMRNAAARMSRLIEDLLAYSRVTMQSGPFEKVSLDAILKEALADLDPRIEETKAQVEAAPLPVVEGDPSQLRQLLQNLIANALKYHKPGVAPKVSIRARPAAAGVQIIVEDDGIGFDLKYLERIFRPFQRLHGRGEYEGSGMGLAICYKIAVRHGGTITATSAPGQGSSFIVTLPSQDSHQVNS